MLEILAGLGLGIVLWHTAAWWLNKRSTRLRRAVLVNLRSGRAFRGVLWERKGRWLVLRDAQVMERGVEPVSLDGEVILDRDAIEFVQVL